MRRQSETRAGNHRRHTRTINASPPTQANNAARAANSNHPTRPLYMHLIGTPHTHHTVPCANKAPGTDKAARHPPWVQQEPVQGTHNWNRGAGALVRNRSKPEQSMRCSKPERKHTHTHTHTHCDFDAFWSLLCNTHTHLSPIHI